jgi:hypothetical protein
VNKLVLCGECYCLVPATHWFGHRFFHQATIRMGLLNSGFTQLAAEQSALQAAESITFEEWIR